MIKRALLALLIPFAGPALAEGFLLGLPVECDLSSTHCYIQQYMDHDPTSGATDYRCQSLSYDGHKGTDFGVPTLRHMAAGVPVIASASGVITSLRDGMPDTGYSEKTATAIAGRECGNGVVIRHQNGWETQYCHLRQGSLSVTKGQAVTTGTPLGLIGKSGRAAFPHLHLSVRKDGVEIDPFDPEGDLTCGAPNPQTLWTHAPAYIPGGLLDIGFTTKIPEYSDVKAGTATASAISPKTLSLVLFGFGYGLQKDDILRLTIEGPRSKVIARNFKMNRNLAQSFRAISKSRRHRLWPSGTYTGTVQLIRAKTIIDTRTTTVTLR